jgi:hypothetical protein
MFDIFIDWVAMMTNDLKAIMRSRPSFFWRVRCYFMYTLLSGLSQARSNSRALLVDLWRKTWSILLLSGKNYLIHLKHGGDTCQYNLPRDSTPTDVFFLKYSASKTALFWCSLVTYNLSYDIQYFKSIYGTGQSGRRPQFHFYFTTTIYYYKHMIFLPVIVLIKS